jgi:molybdopterin synthase catalytic subunit
MAEKEIEKIRSEALKQFVVKKIYIKHRIGRVHVGEASIIVAVLSAHRKEGIKAVDYIIDEIKKKVPIWKKEIFEDGSQRWVKGNV